jgi:hypothetical protein
MPTLTGGIYYWQRQRDRKDVTDGDKYKTNLSLPWNTNLDFQSGYAADMFGIDVAVFAAIEMAESSESAHPNEIAFSNSHKVYDEDWSGDRSGASLYKAAAKFKYGVGEQGISSRRGKRCWHQTGALCRAPIRGGSRRKTGFR